MKEMTMIKNLLFAALLLLPHIDVLAQAVPSLSGSAHTSVEVPQPGQERDGEVLLNEITIGAQLTDVDTDSARFNQYRDLDDGLYLYRLRVFSLWGDSRFLEVRGRNVGRDDQNAVFRFGESNLWRVEAKWDQIPNRISNHAMTPYTLRGGLLTVPSHVGILTDTPDGSNYFPSDALVNDQLVANYLAGNLEPIRLGTQRTKGTLLIAHRPLAALRLGLRYSDETKEGTKVTYGPLGDRPPRTLNVELPEPVDYNTRDLRFDADFSGSGYQLHFTFEAPRFENDVNTMTWESMFFGPDPAGADFNRRVILTGPAIARRAVSTFGQRALPPDNRYENALLSFGIDTPLEGKVIATASVARMKQNELLLPYSYSTLTTDWNSLDRLPRLRADAEISTTLLSIDYLFQPLPRLNTRVFFRSYDLDNDTPADQWHYATQDSASTTGGVSYKNRRVNLAYGFDRTNYGLESSYSVRRNTFTAGIEREEIGRDFREADTDETIFRASINSRMLDGVTMRLRYLFGNRDAGPYDWSVTRLSYWYSPAHVGTDADNPAFAFTNHPDLRRYDVSDRIRNELDLRVTALPHETVTLSVAAGLRDNDYDSNVRPVQPLAGTSFAAAPFQTPGIQLGLLEDQRRHVTLDAVWMPAENWSVTAFVNREKMEILQRGMAFNENARTNAQDALLASPGQAWTDARSHWIGATDDDTTTVGLGGHFEVIPERLTFSADYAYSRGSVDIDYSGYGSDQPLTTAYYAFRSPETVEHKQHVLNASLEYELRRGWKVGLNYLFDTYDVTDFMQEPIGGWVEEVGSTYYLRDTTRDNRWGNRLVRMGDYLAPAYDGHVASLTLSYNW
jgi:MtrB/PioB family decaheme-associated outer membrane protein